MVDPDSDRVSRAPPYSGYRRRLFRFGYAAFTLSDAPSQKLPLQKSFLQTPYAVLQPRLMRFGLLPVRSPLLGESLLISFPELLRWFTSLSMTPVHYVFMHSGGAKTHRITPFGHPGITGYVLLLPAFRSLSRPSSPYGSQASAIDLYSLDHIILSAPLPFRSCCTQA